MFIMNMLFKVSRPKCIASTFTDVEPVIELYVLRPEQLCESLGGECRTDTDHVHFWRYHHLHGSPCGAGLHIREEVAQLVGEA